MKVVTNKYAKDKNGNYNPQDKITVTYWKSENGEDWQKISFGALILAERNSTITKNIRKTEEFVKDKKGNTLKNITRFYKTCI